MNVNIADFLLGVGFGMVLTVFLIRLAIAVICARYDTTPKEVAEILQTIGKALQEGKR